MCVLSVRYGPDRFGLHVRLYTSTTDYIKYSYRIAGTEKFSKPIILSHRPRMMKVK